MKKSGQKGERAFLSALLAGSCSSRLSDHLFRITGRFGFFMASGLTDWKVRLEWYS